MFLSATFVVVLALQDDLGRLIEKLKSDEFAERENAQRALERLGMSALPRLKAEAANETELDTKVRLKALIEKIPKLDQLRQVYGPTRRATYSATNETLIGVVVKLTELLEETIVFEGFDYQSRITLKLEDTTLWESLDELARVTKSHYVYGSQNVMFYPGEAPKRPVVYLAQFRISVAEIKKIDYRSPGEKQSCVLLVPEVRYQRNLKPAGIKYGKVFDVESIESPRGEDVQIEHPSWVGGTWAYERSCALEAHYFLNPSVESVSMIGKAKLSFSAGTRELSFPLAGENQQETNSDGTFRIAQTGAELGKLTVKLEIEVPEAGGLNERFRGVWVDDKDGKRQFGSIRGMNRDGKKFSPDLWFPVAPENVKTIGFKWLTGVHAFEIPFKLEDIKVPKF